MKQKGMATACMIVHCVSNCIVVLIELNVCIQQRLNVVKWITLIEFDFGKIFKVKFCGELIV